jgi:hypothetical protein
MQSVTPALRGACNIPRKHSLIVPARAVPPRGRSEGTRLASAPSVCRCFFEVSPCCSFLLIVQHAAESDNL